MIGDRKKLTAYSLQLTAGKGFTLIEMLVAMSLFVIATTFATDLYIGAQRTGRAVRAHEKLQNEMRLAFETVAREIRSGTIDYSAYAGGATPVPSDILRLKDSAGTAITFRPGTGNECPTKSFPCLLICDAAGACSSLTSQNIIWDEIRFYVSPQNDPFVFDPTVGSYLADSQPRVTVFAQARNESNLPEEKAAITLQTAATSRIYKR